MPYSGPPPEDASTWPFPCLLDFCLANGLGSAGTAGQTPWTAKSFAQASSGLSYKTVEAWLQGINAPEEKLDEVIAILTKSEPSRFRAMWERALIASCENFRSIPPEKRKETVTGFRTILLSKLPSVRSFRSALRTLGVALLENDNKKLAEFSRRTARNMSFDSSNQKKALSLVKLGRQARLGNDNDSSRQSLDEAIVILGTELQYALNLIGLASEAFAEKGQLLFDEGKFYDAADNYFRALLYQSRENREATKKLISQFWYSVNNHIRASQDYTSGKKLLSLSQWIALVPDSIALTQLMRLSTDFERASKYFRQYVSLGYKVDAKFATSAIASAQTPDQVELVVAKLKASGHEMSPISLSATLAKAANFVKAKQILDDIKATGTDLKIETFGAIMHQAPNVSTALALEVEMRAANIAPNSFTISSVVEKTHGFDESKERLLGYLKEGIKLNQVPFNILIKKAPNKQAAWEVVAIMDSNNVDVDSGTIDVLVEKATDLDESLSILRRLDYDEKITSDYSISMMLRRCRNYSECRKYFFQYRRTIKANLTGFSHNSLLYLATSDKEKSEAIGLKREDGLQPSMHEFGILTKSAGSFAKAKAVVESMPAAKLAPNTIVCNNLLRQAQSKDEVDFVLSLFEKYRLKPDQYTMAMRIAKSASFMDAIKTSTEIFKLGVKPNNVTEEKIRQKMSRKADVDEYLRVVARFSYTIADLEALERTRESLP